MGNVIKFNDYFDTKAFENDLKVLAKSVKDISQEIIDFVEHLKTLNKLNEQAKATYSETAKNINETKKATQEYSALEKERIKIGQQHEQLMNKINITEEENYKKLQETKIELQEKNKVANDEIKINRAAEGSYNKLSLQLKKQIGEYQALGKAERESTKGKEMLKSIQATDKELKTFDTSMGRHQRNVGNYQGALRGVTGLLGGFGLAIGGTAAIVKTFNGIVQSTQTLSDDLAESLAGAKASVDLFFRAIATGDWKDFGKRLRDARDAAKEYTKGMDELGDLRRSLAVQEDEAKIRLTELEVIMRSTGLEDSKRKKAAEEFIEITRKLANARKEYADQELKLTIPTVAKQMSTTEDMVMLMANNYDQIKDIIREGNAYNDLLERRTVLELSIGDAMSKVAQPKRHKEISDSIAKINEEMENLRKSSTESGRDMDESLKITAIYQSSNDKLLQQVADSTKKVSEATYSYNQETRRAQVTLSSMNKELGKEGELKKAQRLTSNIANIEKNAQLEVNIEKEKLLNKEINEEQYQLRLLEIQQSTADKLENITGLSEAQKLNYKTRSLDAEIALQKQGEQREKADTVKRLEEIERSYDDQVELNRSKLLAGEIDEQEFARNILLIQIETSRLSLEIADLTADEKRKIEERLFNEKVRLMNMEVEKEVDTTDKIVEKRKLAAEDLIEIYQRTFDVINGLYENEIAAIDLKEQYAIDMAGNSEVVKDRIRKQYAEERKKIERKQAIANKTTAIFDAAINTAVAITSALKVGPTPLGIALAIIVGLLGAVQIGIIAKKPIPQFKHGIKGIQQETLAEVAEEGREIIRHPSGKMFLAEGRQYTYLPKGSDVIPNYETEKILQGGATYERWNDMIVELQETRKALINRPVNETRLTEKGLEYYAKKANQEIKYINKYFRG